MTKKNLLLIFCTVFISACSIYAVNYEETATAFYPPKKSSLEVKYIEDITSPHEVIGFVTINTERRQRMSEIIEKMKRGAAVLGGDAITNITMNSSDGTKEIKGKNFFSNAYIRATFTATVVVLKK